MCRTNDILGYNCSAFPPSFLKTTCMGLCLGVYTACVKDLQNQLLGKSLLKGINPGAALEPGSVQTFLVIACRKGI